ncbi:PmoA family protein [Flagellimonas myxillae]|uniref:DUF6807 domain-containing protein n=1 Tax=Flagellimonas myxillae TaxID=2942214 RepID=UPI00201EF738|nr:PmoA family protein [Muricauda myxillae]MCL6265037.1 PmoA family protein [Muricauda myxillae]
MKSVFFFLIILLLSSCQENGIVGFEVGKDGFEGPVAVDLEPWGLSPEEIILTKEENDGVIEVPFQQDSEASGKIWFLHTASGSTRYSLDTKKAVGDPTATVDYELDGEILQLRLQGNPVVSYRHKTKYPPKGVDSIFRKSGYVHPLMTPKGDTLTRIQPPDHYHHYGIWGPWTRTRIGERSVDFWNLGEGQGTVTFKEFGPMVSGKVFTSFTAHQEHLDLGAGKQNSIALNETIELRLWNSSHPDRYLLDYTSNFSSPLESGILLEAYRYGGGLGMRFTERWDKDNCKVLTSEGKDRFNADGSNARWCMVSGESSDGKGTNGILFLSHPQNRMHPEPMRIWPVDSNGGRGDMFFEFCPIRHEPWQIASGKNYQLTYRMVVFEGELTAAEAEAYWQVFAKLPQIIKLKD